MKFVFVVTLGWLVGDFNNVLYTDWSLGACTKDGNFDLRLLDLIHDFSISPC